MAVTTQPDVFAGRFAVRREVGQGASGIVFGAVELASGASVALKVLVSTGGSHVEAERFLREGELLSALRHPGIVAVLAYGTLEEPALVLGRAFDVGTPYLAMELIEGETLESRMRKAALPLRDAVEVTRQVASALSAAHEAGIVHRDIKPANLFLVRSQSGSESAKSRHKTLSEALTLDDLDDVEETLPPRSRATIEAPKPEPIVVRLVDFGVAANEEVQLARTDMVVGTPAYMAPEQARGDSVDARSDLYSLGATLFELIAGHPPHVGTSSLSTLARLVTSPAPRLSEQLLDVPEALDDLVWRMLSPDPEGRPASAREVEDELAEILRDPAISKRLPVAHERESGVSGTRLVTTIVALSLGTGDARREHLKQLQAQEVEAMPLGRDSIVAHLGVRVAHGDEAVRGVDLARRLAEAGARVGVATGRSRIDRSRPAGEVVDRGAALAREAEAGSVLADLATVELVRARFEFTMQRAGVQRLRGEARAKKDAPASSFVGREPELDAMTAAYRRVLEDRTPVLVSVSGPPGIGKSRLVREAVAAVRAPSSASAAEPVVVEGRCEPFGVGQPLGVAAELGRALLKLPRDATLEQASAAIERRARLAGDTELLARLFANQPFPSGLDSARESLYLSLTELALGATSAAPCTLVVEDAQWSDPESMAWLDHLLSRAGGRPLFVLLAMRPAFWRDQAQRFLGRDHVRLELKPLARKATREIARALLGERATEELLDKLATQAAGSPLFAEELARISAAGKDATRAPTIEAAIQVSLDSLEDAVRDGVVRASVFGMRVWDLGAEAVGVFNPTPVLAKLVSAEVLVEEATSVFSSARQFMFKHALVRDVAYAMASDEQKKLLHAWAARWLDGIGEDAATVAQHFDLGGEREEAAIRWERAARRALATNSLVDAMKMAERALAFATTKEVGFARARLLDEAHSRLDARSAEREEAVMAMQEHTYDEESEIRTMGARARYDDARGKGGVEERLEEVVGRARALGLVDEEARCTATLANRYAFAGQLPKAEDEAARLLRLAERPQLEWAAVDAWQTLAVVRQTKGQLAAGVEARRAAAQAARAAGLQEREAVLTINLGFALITLGARQEALHEIESGIAKAQAIGSSGAVRHGRMNLLGWAATFGSDARLDAELAETRAVADEAAGAGWLMPDRATLGVLFYRGVELLRGDAPHLPRARALLKIAAESYRATQNRDVLPVALGFWAEAERKSGHADEANVLATEAASLVEGGAPSLLNEAPIFLALHDSCVDRGDFPGARRALERAMPALRRRLAGLEGTPYARSFVTQLPHNAALLAAAESYGSVPSDLQAMLDARR